MSRRLIASLVLALPLAALVGCSGSSSPSAPAGGGAGPKGSAEQPKKVVPVEKMEAPKSK